MPSSGFGELAQPRRLEQKLDWLADFVIPGAVFGLLGSLLYFLIDLRQYLVGGEAAILRYVVFWFLLGVIGLARLAARPQTTSTPPIVYAAALASVVALAVVNLSRWEGTFAARVGAASPLWAVIFNLGTVAGIWAAAWFLTGVCTRLEHALEELRSGGVTSGQAYASATATPLRAILAISGIAVAVFGYGLGIVEPGNPLRGHAFVCAGTFLFFALLLMMFVSLGAARLVAHQNGLRVRSALTAVWVAGGLALALAAVIGAGALPGVSSRIRPRPPGTARSWAEGEEQGPGVGVHPGRSAWAERLPGGLRELLQRLSSGRQPQPGAPPRPDQGQGRAQLHLRPMPVPQRLAWPWWLLIVLAFLALLSAVWWQRRRIAAAARWVVARLMAVLAALARVLGVFRRKRDGVVLAELPADPWADIFALAGPDKVDARLAVKHVWRALQLYYDALGLGRREHETEMEFARRAPGRLYITANDLRQTALLYCAAEYGESELGQNVAGQMQAIWERLMASVNAAAKAAPRAS
ncbi:MAG: hypothetical protein H5T86_02305 [Armatimonadetes bacterium]|nr:hypothetical protein [Armatimonadota bacterium]